MLFLIPKGVQEDDKHERKTFNGSLKPFFMTSLRDKLTVSVIVGAVMGGLLMIQPKPTTAADTYPGHDIPITISQHQSFDLNKVVFTIVKLAPPLAPKPKLTRLDVWLNKLARVESNGRAKIKVLDRNGYYSYGCLQFQMGTFKSYMKKHGLVTKGTSVDWEPLIYDCGVQKNLAKLMIQDDYDNWEHWYNSVLGTGLGLPPKPPEVALKR